MAFADDVQGVFDGHGDRSRPIQVMVTPQAFIQAGFKAHLIFVTVNVLEKVLIHKHALPLEFIKALPIHLKSPLAIYRSDTVAESIVAVLAHQLDGNPIVAAIRIDAQVGRIDAHMLTSVYGKNHSDVVFEQWKTKGLLLWQA